MSTSGEQQPLLKKKESGASSVHFSDRVVDDSLRDQSSLGQLTGEDDLPQRGSLVKSESSVARMFHALTKSQRDQALARPGVGGAAFLIRDAVLGNANPAAGATVLVRARVFTRASCLCLPSDCLYCSGLHPVISRFVRSLCQS